MFFFLDVDVVKLFMPAGNQEYLANKVTLHNISGMPDRTMNYYGYNSS